MSIIRFVNIGTRRIALHKVCGSVPAPQDSTNVLTDGGEIIIPGKDSVAAFHAALDQYEKDCAPRPPGRPPSEKESTGPGQKG